MSTPEPRTPTSPYRDNNDASSDYSPAQWKRIGAALVNEENAKHNADTSPLCQTFNTAAIFRSNTIAPSPPPPSSTTHSDLSNLALDTSLRLLPTDSLDGHSSPLSAGLRIQTDIIPSFVTPSNNNTARSYSESSQIPPPPLRTPSRPLTRTPSIKNILASSVGSNSNVVSTPGSTISSPMLNALADVRLYLHPLCPATRLDLGRN